MNTNTATLSAILSRAITLKTGGVIVIPCNSFEEMEVARTRLYKLRNQLSKKFSILARSLDIRRTSRDGKWTLYIAKEDAIDGVLIIENGEARPFEIDGEEEEEAKRREELDGEEEKTEEETEEVKDFDEVAAEIEAAQNLKEEEEVVDDGNL